METESITVDPFAKARKLRFTDLTGAGKAELYSEREDGVAPSGPTQMASEGQCKKPLAEGSREPSGP